jgi:lauroyl/myristoyl acyltransferase
MATRGAAILALSVITGPSPTELRADNGRPRWHSHPYNRAGLYRVAAAMGWLPRPARLALARQVGRWAGRLLPVERAAVRRTLARMTSAQDRRLDELTGEVFANFAMCFSDLVTTNRQPAGRLAEHLGGVIGAESFPGPERGIVSLTAHVGNWELAGRLLAGRAARPTRVVVTEDEARELEPWVRRNGDGVRFVARTRPTVSLELVAALRRGEVVAMQGDRALGSRGDIQLPFFGLPAPFPTGPFLLARAAGAAIVPAFCLLGPGGRYTVTVGEPVTVPAGGEVDAVQAWVTLLEDVAQRHPTQWFNFFDVWNPPLLAPTPPGSR